ncbi:MAG: Hachiman antiphage defense system protein HamA [Planctomycetota bacterium]
MSEERKRSEDEAQETASAGLGFLEEWLRVQEKKVGIHRARILTENDGTRSSAVSFLQKALLHHYEDPKLTADRLEFHGHKKCAELFREKLPEIPTLRSGELGEVIATELAERMLGFTVPIRRLRWKDGRNVPLRGDDLVAFIADANSPTRYLKGESKSYQELSSSVLEKADEQLLADSGRPTRHSVMFVADRLREKGDHELAAMLETHLLDSFRGCDIEHLLFAMCGNSPDTMVSTHLSSRGEPLCHAVALRVVDHQEFIASVYEKRP